MYGIGITLEQAKLQQI